MFGWQPIPFGNFSEIDSDDEHAKDAKRLMGDRYRPDYIGLSCEGEVGFESFVLCSV